MLLASFVISLVVLAVLIYVLPGITTSRRICAFVAAFPVTAMNMLLSGLMTHYQIGISGFGFALVILVLDFVFFYLLTKILDGIQIKSPQWAFVFSVFVSGFVYLSSLIFGPGYFVVL